MSDIEKIAIERLKAASEMSLANYGLPLVITDSGGKDSSVCKELALHAGIPFEVMHNHTTADAPETVRFVRSEAKRFEDLGIKYTINMPTYKGKRTSMWGLIPQTHAIINGKKPWKDDVKADTVLKWYNGLHTDSAEYKMWGNGIALPCARIPLRGIAQLGAKTLASLFDGSGGFPLAGSLEGIEPRWSSEVEPYPIAVTVHQFGGLG